MISPPRQFKPVAAPMSITVHHDRAESRFVAEVDGHLARCDYRLRDDTLLLVHTEVPPPLEGRGIGSALVRAALDYAAGASLGVRPLCSFVRAYLARHPEYRPLLR